MAVLTDRTLPVLLTDQTPTSGASVHASRSISGWLMLLLWYVACESNGRFLGRGITLGITLNVTLRLGGGRG
jgi:hypothetical protein